MMSSCSGGLAVSMVLYRVLMYCKDFAGPIEDIIFGMSDCCFELWHV